jgi:membrane-bound metal-dependent hydrolase YbcI (DUF457 family)
LPYPVGHSLVAWTVGIICRRRHLTIPEWKTALWWSFLAVSPDFDFLMSTFTGDYDLHRTGTHSLITAVVVGMLLAIIEFRALNWRRGLLYTALIGSHCMLDWGATKAAHTSGPALFWPLTNQRYALGIRTLPEIVIPGVPVALQPFFELVQICVVELLIFLPVFLVLQFFLSYFRRTQAITAE